MLRLSLTVVTILNLVLVGLNAYSGERKLKITIAKEEFEQGKIATEILKSIVEKHVNLEENTEFSWRFLGGEIYCGKGENGARALLSSARTMRERNKSATPMISISGGVPLGVDIGRLLTNDRKRLFSTLVPGDKNFTWVVGYLRKAPRRRNLEIVVVKNK